MVKKLCFGGLVMLLLVAIFISIKIDKIDKKKIEDVKYTVLLEENIPEEIVNELDRYKINEGKYSYICNDKLYIVICYGKQETSGYTIVVNGLYESTNAIFVETTLMGPVQDRHVGKGVKQKKEKEENKEDCPYIVLELSLCNKIVVFI